MYVCLSACVSVYLRVCLSVCLCVCLILSTYLRVSSDHSLPTLLLFLFILCIFLPCFIHLLYLISSLSLSLSLSLSISLSFSPSHCMYLNPWSTKGLHVNRWCTHSDCRHQRNRQRNIRCELTRPAGALVFFPSLSLSLSFSYSLILSLSLSLSFSYFLLLPLFLSFSPSPPFIHSFLPLFFHFLHPFPYSSYPSLYFLFFCLLLSTPSRLSLPSLLQLNFNNRQSYARTCYNLPRLSWPH